MSGVFSSPEGQRPFHGRGAISKLEEWNRIADVLTSEEYVEDTAIIFKELEQEFVQQAIDMKNLKKVDRDIRRIASTELGYTAQELRAIEPKSLKETYDFICLVMGWVGDRVRGFSQPATLQPSPNIQQPAPTNIPAPPKVEKPALNSPAPAPPKAQDPEEAAEAEIPEAPPAVAEVPFKATDGVAYFNEHILDPLKNALQQNNQEWIDECMTELKKHYDSVSDKAGYEAFLHTLIIKDVAPSSGNACRIVKKGEKFQLEMIFEKEGIGASAETIYAEVHEPVLKRAIIQVGGETDIQETLNEISEQYASAPGNKDTYRKFIETRTFTTERIVDSYDENGRTIKEKETRTWKVVFNEKTKRFELKSAVHEPFSYKRNEAAEAEVPDDSIQKKPDTPIKEEEAQPVDRQEKNFSDYFNYHKQILPNWRDTAIVDSNTIKEVKNVMRDLFSITGDDRNVPIYLRVDAIQSGTVDKSNISYVIRIFDSPARVGATELGLVEFDQKNGKIRSKKFNNKLFENHKNLLAYAEKQKLKNEKDDATAAEMSTDGIKPPSQQNSGIDNALPGKPEKKSSFDLKWKGEGWEVQRTPEQKVEYAVDSVAELARKLKETGALINEKDSNESKIASVLLIKNTKDAILSLDASIPTPDLEKVLKAVSSLVSTLRTMDIPEVQIAMLETAQNGIRSVLETKNTDNRPWPKELSIGKLPQNEKDRTTLNRELSQMNSRKLLEIAAKIPLSKIDLPNVKDSSLAVTFNNALEKWPDFQKDLLEITKQKDPTVRQQLADKMLSNKSYEYLLHGVFALGVARVNREKVHQKDETILFFVNLGTRISSVLNSEVRKADF